MTDKEKKTQTEKRIDENQRFRYIGFEVFPHKPKDLFKSDADRQKFVEAVKKKRQKGELLREECTLVEERVSMGEQIVLAVASVVILIALFLPWYSVYNEAPQKPAIRLRPLPHPILSGSPTRMWWSPIPRILTMRRPKVAWKRSFRRKLNRPRWPAKPLRPSSRERNPAARKSSTD